MPVKASNVQSTKGVKKPSVQSKKSEKKTEKANGAGAKASTNTKPTTKTTTTKKGTVKSPSVKKCESRSAHAIPKTNSKSSKNGKNIKVKQKGMEQTNLHPEVKKLIEMLTKLTQNQQRTPAYKTDNQSYAGTETDGSSLSDDESSFTSSSSNDFSCDCSDDWSDGDDEHDDLGDDNDTDDDTSDCSGCSNCGFFSKEFTVLDSTDSSDNNCGICSGCSDCDGTSTEDSEWGESDGNIVVAKLKKKPMKKRTTASKSRSKKKSSTAKNTTKKTTNSKSKKLKVKKKVEPKKAIKNAAKPAAKAHQKHQIHASNLPTKKKEPKLEYNTKIELPSTSLSCASTLKQTPKSTMLKMKPKIEPVTPITPAHCSLTKANSTFNKPLKKSSNNSHKTNNKIWRP